MNWRSITFRLVALYCGLLLLLGASFSLFTILSFERYTGATFQTNLAARATDVWRIVQPVLDKPAQVSLFVEQRFSPSAQDRFIRISREGRVIYRSDAPDDDSFDPATIPLLPPIEKVLGAATVVHSGHDIVQAIRNGV